MDIKQVVIFIFILLIVVYLVINTFSRSTPLTKMEEGKKTQNIKANKIKNANNSSNFTYSMWLYVDDWNYNFGKEKTVLDRANSPTVVLGDKPNTLKVYMNYFDKTLATPDVNAEVTANTPMNAATEAACASCQSGYTCACADCNNGIPDGTAAIGDETTALGSSASALAKSANTSTNTCLITNVPIQKWVNIIISLYGLTLDIYLDGKLVRTCVLPGVPSIKNNTDLFVTNNGGFSGWTTSFRYWSDASNPQQAYNIYKDGYGGSILGNLLSKYRVRVSMMSDNEEKSSFEI